MRDFILKKVKEGAEEMYNRNGRVSPWHLSRNIHVSAGVIEECLGELGYVREGTTGNFVLKGDRGKAAAKEPKRLEDADISSFKVSNDIEEFPNEVDYTAFSLNELRSIASNKGIDEVGLSLSKREVIEKLKSRSKLSG